MVMITMRIAPVGIVLPSSASAWFPPARRSAMMPEPTTAATRREVPTASAASRRTRVGATLNSRSGCLMFSAADVVEAPLQRERVERGHRKADEDRDAALE